MRDSISQIKSALGNKYEIKHLIESGGMGKIFLGVHKKLDRKVAIKIIHQELVANEQIKSRFIREARLAANLNHSGIIDIYDFGSKDDFDYIIMPFIEGETLADKIKNQGAFSPEEGVRILIQIAEALHYAHTHNVIHRDVKPSNIMFDRQGKMIITDFGVSKDMTDSDLTAPNTILGSPRYMSPEQIKGQAVDGRSDLYSLGLIFYEMLTGNHPFQDKDTTAIYYAQAHEIPPEPITQKPDIPQNISAIIMKLLNKAPEGRYADGGALIKDLQDHLNGNFSIGSGAYEDVTLADDATFVDDFTMVMGDLPAPGDEPESYDDATVVASSPPASVPFYKRHIKALAGAGIAFFLMIIIITIIGSDPPETKPVDPNITVSTKPDTTETKPDPAKNATKAQETPIPLNPETKPQLSEPVTQVKPPPKSVMEAIFAINSGNVADHFSIWTDRDTYRIGEAVTFHFESKQPCYVVVLGYNTQGDLVQIFPNHYAPGQFIQANREYAIPDEQMDFDLQVFGPAGQETVIALVSGTPLELFDTPFNADNPFRSFNEREMSKAARFYQRIDAIKDRNISQQRLVYHIIN